MTDRELLELAAKAAGVPNHELYDTIGDNGGVEKHGWNPLDDDGDALRLAVDLNIGFRNLGHVMAASCEAGQFNEYADGDPYSATRLAIVRAAASIGDAMEGGKS